jgi:membrane glycosyltransferase
VNTKQRSWVAGTMLLVVLGSGIGIGIALGRTWLSPKAESTRRLSTEARTARLLKRFRKKLRLDDTQTRAIEAALKASFMARATARARIAPELQSARERLRAQINALLNDAQRATYAEMVKAYDARRTAANK